MASGLPHEGVYARLGVSRVEGIGVFAIRPIPEGTDIFPSDRQPIVWVSLADLERAGLSATEALFYRDFGIRRGNRIGCPQSFGNLTASWYLNEPPDGAAPNVRAAADFSLIASRDIAEGEELLIDYASFSETPDD